MNLYELTNDHVQALDDLSQMLEDGSIDEQGFNEAIHSMDGELNEKIINFAAYIENLSADIGPMEKAIDSMRKRLKALKDKDKRLRDRLKSCMVRAGKVEVKAPIFDVKIHKNPPKITTMADPVSVTEAVKTYLPEAIKEKVSTSIDLDLIKRVLKSDPNHPLHNWYALETGTRLYIK